MSKKKLQRLAELETFPNVFQLQKELQGNWNRLVFKNSNPITLELACGKGEYSLAMARKFPQRNFIGIDIKGARIWRGAKTAMDEQLINVAFLRTYIDHLPEYFLQDEVEEIWILFPDPYVKKSKENKRLTSSSFLKRYQQIIKTDGLVHLKTDDNQLFQFTLETLMQQGAKIIFRTSDLYSEDLPDEILNEKTFYEKMHLANKKTIKYVKFILK